MRWFDAIPRRTTPKGHESFISCTAAHQESPAYIRLLSARVAHQYRSLAAIGKSVVADDVRAGVEDLPDERGGPLRTEVHRVAGTQDAGRAPLGQQPAQAGGGVGDVLPPVRGGLAVPGVFRLGAVLVPVPGAGGQAAGQSGGLEPEFLAGGGQVRRGGPGQGRVAVGQMEVGGQVGVLVVPARGQVGLLIWTSSFRQNISNRARSSRRRTARPQSWSEARFRPSMTAGCGT